MIAFTLLLLVASAFADLPLAYRYGAAVPAVESVSIQTAPYNTYVSPALRSYEQTVVSHPMGYEQVISNPAQVSYTSSNPFAQQRSIDYTSAVALPLATRETYQTGYVQNMNANPFAQVRSDYPATYLNGQQYTVAQKEYNPTIQTSYFAQPAMQSRSDVYQANPFVQRTTYQTPAIQSSYYSQPTMQVRSDYYQQSPVVQTSYVAQPAARSDYYYQQTTPVVQTQTGYVQNVNANPFAQVRSDYPATYLNGQQYTVTEHQYNPSVQTSYYAQPAMQVRSDVYQPNPFVQQTTYQTQPAQASYVAQPALRSDYY